jgi:DNA-directed RNA polymerase subunit beta
LDKGKKFTAEFFEEVSFAVLKDIDFTAWKKDETELNMFFERYRQQAELVRNRYEGIVSRHRKGDDLPPGVIRMVKIYVAVKRKLAVGDKMAGRHGNKGVVSRILPEEDMPFFADGTPVDIVLNPLGVPSRMNVGQVLEAHLGMAASRLGKQLQELGERRELAALREKLQSIYSEEEYQQLTDGLSDDELLDLARKYGAGVHIATPVFDGAAESEIRDLLVQSDFDETGQVTLYDGLTGDSFDRAHVYAETAPPGGQQNPCPVNRSLFPGYPAAPWRQGAIRWAAAW